MEEAPVSVIEAVSATVIKEVFVPGSWNIESDYHFIEFEVSCNTPSTNYIPLFVSSLLRLVA